MADSQTNMDNKKNPNASVDVFEFTLPKNEVDQALDVGSFGEVMIPVEVLSVGEKTYTFRKRASAHTDKPFQDEPLAVMRERIGVKE